MESGVKSRTTEELSPDQLLEVRQHLQQVLESPAFAGSKRAQDFLRLVVNHALVGEYDSLRERMIGAEMFGRRVDYDTGSDSVVRVKATEVRKKLAQYYLETGPSTLRIELPSGSYVPRFVFSPAESPAQIHVVPAEPVWIEDPPPPAAVREEPAPPASLPPRPRSWQSAFHAPRMRWLAGLGLVLALIAVALVARHLLNPGNAVPIRTIAILPMENHSGIPSEEYIADGMTGEIVGTLGQVSKLNLSSMASVARFKDTQETPAQLGRELNVDGLVQESIMREGSRVLIYVWLTAVKTNHVIWFHSYVRDLKTALAWQGEVSSDIAKGIQGAVTPQSQARYSPSRPVEPVAQDLYLHGKYLLDAEDCSNAADYFRAALNINFYYPEAQAALAFCDGHLGESDRVDSLDAFRAQKLEASRAIALNPNLAEGHAELANASMNLNWDWAAAGKELHQALELNRRSGSIHEEYERYLVRTGRISETLAEVRQNEDMDPFSSRLYHLEGFILYYCRQYDQALMLVQKVRTLDIPPPNWHLLLGEIYAEKGSYADSIAEFLHAGTRPQALGHLGNVYARAGKTEDALAVISQLEDNVRNEGIGRYEIALVYAGLGKKEEAFKWLEESYRTRDEGLTYLKVEPCLDPLRKDPHFADLLNRVGLAQ